MLDAVKINLFQELYVPVLRHTPEHNDGYYLLMKELWEAKEPFIINEHDVIAWPGAIGQLVMCSNPWCTFPYRARAGWLSNGLGLVKFDPTRLPDIFQEEFRQRSWRHLDMQMAR